MGSQGVVLVIEDSDEDFHTVKRLLGKVTGHLIERCPDVPAAERYLGFQHFEERPALVWPSIILLDLNLPGEDGRSLLARLKRDDRLRRIPIVILTTSSNSRDLEYCYNHGAAGYIVKPVDLAKLRDILEKFAAYWLQSVLLPPPMINP